MEVTGELPAQPIRTTVAPDGRTRFLGEFGGPPVRKPGEPGFNRTRVEQSIFLSLKDLPPHAALRVSFDLLVLKSWDGNSPAYGPDVFSFGLAGAPKLFESTFSNNPKVAAEGSSQNFPRRDSPPKSGAAAINTLGYPVFFGDATYAFSLTLSHAETSAELEFHSSLFEGKGTEDESWGLRNVRVEALP
jgi:hypothetical protein